MVIKNSIRQLKRTPFKTTFFLLLLTMASAFFSLGGNLWMLNARNTKQYEDTFTTIGIVEQREAAVKQVKRWDAESKKYHIYSKPEYNKAIPLSVLDFEGANYIYGPEWRCYYSAYCPEYDNGIEGVVDSIIVEVSPLVDCIPTDLVKLQIKKVLYGAKSLEGLEISFFNLYDPNPEKLYKGKTYVMSLGEYYSLKDRNDMSTKFMPSYEIKSSQVSSDGEIIEGGISDQYFCDEVTDGFYDTERGKPWMELIKAKNKWYDTIPVTATQHTNLLMPFYTGDVYICKGRDISKGEYQNGTKVCLISEDFARRNQLNVGDSVHLPLYSANYEMSAGGAYLIDGRGYSIYPCLNAKGEAYPIFEDSNYIITGIYDISTGATSGEYGIGKNEVIIPKSSIKNSDENNIAAFQPMKGYNTSFQIPNGKIEQYLAAWKKVGIEGLEITFFDKGYSQLEAGIKNMKNISMIFSVAGFLIVLLVIVFFCNLFITKQLKRTAIERSIGFSKRQCMCSLLSGIFLLILVGSVIGCTAGALLTNKVSKETAYRSYYDYTYGNTAVSSETDDKMDMEYDLTSMIKTSFGMEGIVLFIGITISFIMISSNLKKEPIELLATASKE